MEQPLIGESRKSPEAGANASGMLGAAAQDFLSHSPGSFLSFTDKGHVVFANEELLGLLDYELEEVINNHFDRLLGSGGMIYYQTHLFPLLKLRGAWEEIYLVLRTKSGADLPFLCNARRIVGLNGENAVTHCVLLPMQERQKFESTLIAARKAVEDAAKTKDEFLAMVSHELRTPLTAIMGWLHILHESDYDPEVVKESLEVIERNAGLQSQLIADLLDFSRISVGKLRLEVQRVDLHTILRDAVDVVRPAVSAKRIDLTMVLDPDAGPVSGDPARLQQVFWNLLSNAVKFTPKEGRIQIELRKVRSHALITVSDSGAGIPADFLPYIFERFRQEDESRTRTHGGLGLGLAISKDIVALHGGSIFAKSEGKGKGSTFEVELPISSADADSAEGAKSDTMVPKSNVPSLSGLEIVIVDDIPESVEMIRRILQKAGADVKAFGSGAAVLEYLDDSSPNLLVADLGMPEMDGFGLIRRIRSSEGEQRTLPAIALSALVTAADRINAIESGFQAFLPKPVNPKELLHAIVNLSRVKAKPASDVGPSTG